MGKICCILDEYQKISWIPLTFRESLTKFWQRGQNGRQKKRIQANPKR